MSIRIDKNGHINRGITIASALKLYDHKSGIHPDKNIPLELSLMKANEINKIEELFRDVQLLIIDEFSQLSTIYISHIDLMLRHILRNTNDFGGLIVILAGDELQLHPIIPNEPIYTSVIETIILQLMEL